MSSVDPLDRKAYLNRCERDGKYGNVNYWFCRFVKDAASWNSLRSAEHARDILNEGVDVPSVQGSVCTLRNFEFEMLAPDHYAIYCHVPHLCLERVVPSDGIA